MKFFKLNNKKIVFLYSSDIEENSYHGRILNTTNIRKHWCSFTLEDIDSELSLEQLTKRELKNALLAQNFLLSEITEQAQSTVEYYKKETSTHPSAGS